MAIILLSHTVCEVDQYDFQYKRIPAYIQNNFTY